MYTATGEPGAAGAPALGLVHNSEYLPPELMPSLAACIGADIAVLTRDKATGNVKQRPRLGRQKGQGQWSRFRGTGDCLPAGLGSSHGRQGAWRFLSLHSGSSCLTDATTRPVGGTGDTTLPSFRNSSATWTGGVVVIAATEVRRPGSAPLSRMTRSRALHRHRGKRWCVR
jgi:hypothetical protein